VRKFVRLLIALKRIGQRVVNRVAEPENLKAVPVLTYYLNTVPVPAPVPGLVHTYTYTNTYVYVYIYGT
jgi:hypothetical protein